ncbi:MAG TPA: response regulator [Polyangia bacterium]|nr:response regulator [Polyangia bacterium]
MEQLERDQAFDLVICDLMMPDPDGARVYDLVCAKAPQLVPRIVFMTGGCYTGRLQDFTRSVSNLVLDKPISIEQLREIITRALDDKSV